MAGEGRRTRPHRTSRGGVLKGIGAKLDERRIGTVIRFAPDGRVFVAAKRSDACPSPPGPTDDGYVVTGRLSRLGSSGAATVLIDGESVEHVSAVTYP
jgi:hypothetical protein